MAKNLIALGQTATNWRGMASVANGDVYAAVTSTTIGNIFKQSGGAGNFISLNQTVRNWNGMCAAPNGDIYCCITNGTIYLRAGGIGDFVTLNQTTRLWRGMCAAPNGDIYACVGTGDIYKRTLGTGDFIALSQTSRTYLSMCAAPNGDIYAAVSGGDIYIRAGGIGNFSALSQSVLGWTGMCAAPNGDIYAGVGGATPGDIYKRSGGIGNFVATGQTLRLWSGMTFALNGNFYAATSGTTGDIYKQVNAPPSIFVQPSDSTKIAGQTASFSITASDISFYTWRFDGIPLVNGGRISGADTSALAVSSLIPNDAGFYSVIVSNGVAPDATSQNANLVVDYAPIISVQPSDSTKNLGQDATFVVTASCVPSPSYAWKFDGTFLVDSTRILGSTSASLVIKNIVPTDDGYYSVIISNGVTPDATSQNAGLLVDFAPAILIQPLSVTKTVRDVATFSATASGMPSPSYQWYFNGSALTDDGRISGSTTTTLTINNTLITDAGNYFIVASNGVIPNVTSNVAILTISPETFGNSPGDRDLIINVNKYGKIFGSMRDYP